ncbi:MAG TPA: DNA replication/repair protein RecF [Bacteroidota bacterium]|nr:DNA replication/repair protein RecF [Bacteroidota bacterium]
MRIVRAQLRQFRNHSCTELEFGSTTNALLGDNGHGKTNVLEALSFLCLTKSFYATSDVTALQKGKEFFEVHGAMVSDVAIEHDVRVVYDAGTNRKKVFIDGKEPATYSSVIGQFPIVILSPENNNITFGMPSDRRRFTDLVIAQSSAAYLQDTLEYRRALRQRNKILSEAKRGAVNKTALDPWDETLSIHGSKVMQKRARFFKEFAPFVFRAHASLSQEKEAPSVDYMPQISVGVDEPVGNIKDRFKQKVEEKRDDELRMGTSLVGPHRDEVVFSLNDLQLRAYASQGQHKTFLIALKIAEYFYLKERCAETPVILLDDVFTELDDTRARRLLSLIDELGQSFITTTNEQVFRESIRWNDARRKFSIMNGAAVFRRHEAAA